MTTLTARDLMASLDRNLRKKVLLITPYGHPIPLTSISTTEDAIILVAAEEPDTNDAHKTLWDRLNAKLHGSDNIVQFELPK